MLQAIVRDFQRYAALAADKNANAAALADLESNSLAFRLGVVFQASGPGRAWLVQNGAGTIVQRLTPTSTAPDSSAQTVEAFNIPATGFAVRPPIFTQVKQFAHTNSVAFAWTLVASDLPAGGSAASFGQGDRRLDPEHLLSYYKVHRVRLDGNEAPADFTLKKADVLHRPTDALGQLVRLLSRFQLVDHFANEVESDTDALTEAGKTYLYTITPVDVGGQESTHPLSLVVTRFPSEPPQVPTDGELLIAYGLDKKVPTPGAVPVLHEPAAVVFRWTTPAQPSGQTPVGIVSYQLVFRRESTLPIGYFGSDGGTQGSIAAGLPTSNARPLRTDVVVTLDTRTTPPSTLVDPSTGRNVNAFAIGTDVLEHQGILPAASGSSGRPGARRAGGSLRSPSPSRAYRRPSRRWDWFIGSCRRVRRACRARAEPAATRSCWRTGSRTSRSTMSAGRRNSNGFPTRSVSVRCRRATSPETRAFSRFRCPTRPKARSGCCSPSSRPR